MEYVAIDFETASGSPDSACAIGLVRKDAAMLITDADAPEKLMPAACSLVTDSGKCRKMEKNILALARTDAADRIADEIYRLVKN